MRRILLAIRVFFVTLFNARTAERIAAILAGAEPAGTPPRPDAPHPKARAQPGRSDAVTLLATLQREARFVDFIQEPLAGYADAQIGAAARDVHRDCAAAIERLFGLRPLAADEEGSEVDVPEGFDPGQYRLTGNVTGGPPLRGRLVHPGWEATRCALPSWSGSAAAARVVAPVEVELE